VSTLLRYPGPLEIVNSPEAFDPDRPDQQAAVFLRDLTGLDQPELEPVDAEGVWVFWIDRIVDLIVSGRDFVGIIDGDPGEGKSTLALEFCSRVRNALNAELGIRDTFDPRRDVLSRLSNLLYRIYQSSGDRPVVLQADEGCLVGAQARSGTSEEGLMLDQGLSVCRIKGCTIFVLHPTIAGVAATVKQRRGRYWFHVEERGRATAFKVRTSLPKNLLRDLPFTKERQPYHRIIFDSLEGDPLWVSYSQVKIEATNRTLLDLALRAVALEFVRGLSVPDWAVPYLEKRKPRWWVQETSRPRDQSAHEPKATERARTRDARDGPLSPRPPTGG
jgi:hypothetical protein